ncbi:MAG: sigma-E factor negative regulatory protein RseC, partial [Thermosediminibacterales bacterium]|nr:sigma-E factor negative regulatory protein RseC [Thermosediminibacterales bacterium]
IKLFNNNIKKNSRFIPKILSISLIDDNNDIET